MDKTFEKIINEGCKSGKTIEAINKELEEAGANFHLNADGTVAGWTEAEMNEGFTPAKEEPADVRHLHDYMRYDATKSGLTVRVETPEGVYDITWNEDGNPVKAVRV